MKTLVLSASIASFFIGCAAMERVVPSTLSDANLISVLNTIDVSEIEVAQLAVKKASLEPVRMYAVRMVNDHNTMRQNNLQFERQIQIEPDKPKLASSMERAHQEVMEDLAKKSGEDFDRAFIAYQVIAHRQALALAKDTADAADDVRLKQHLRRVQPDLQIHLAAAQNLQRQLAVQQQ